MNIKKMKIKCHIPTPWFVTGATLGWLIIISLLHFCLNGEHGKRHIITMGYMPVITNLAAPILDYATIDGDGVRFKALKFSSFAEMAEALRNDQIQAAFMIAPLSIVLKQQGEDVKIVYIGNRHESTLVVRKDLHITSINQLAGRSLAVPMRYSGHNLSIKKIMAENGLTGSIKVVEMNPPDMAAALASGSLDAYYVGEPFAAQTIKSGDADILYHVEDVWENFICNLVLVRKEFVDSSPEIVKEMVQGAARSGIWAGENTKKAAQIAAQYWNQSAELVEYALSTPRNRIIYDRFIPVHEEMQHIADLMLRFDMIKDNDITGLIEDKFAKTVDLNGIADIKSILN